MNIYLRNSDIFNYSLLFFHISPCQPLPKPQPQQSKPVGIQFGNDGIQVVGNPKMMITMMMMMLMMMMMMMMESRWSATVQSDRATSTGAHLAQVRTSLTSPFHLCLRGVRRPRRAAAHPADRAAERLRHPGRGIFPRISRQ